MTSPTSWPTRDRYHRNVRRARLLVSPEAPRHRLASAIEDSLRNVTLPGEAEGRTYYFRHLRIGGLTPPGDRTIWLDRFQSTMRAQAARAVHGADPRAMNASVIYFHSEQEAMEILLHCLLRHRSTHEWFWPMVIGTPRTRASASDAPTIEKVIESLRCQSASWVSVAVAVFSDPGLDVVRLLNAIPPATLRGWLQFMDAPPPTRSVVGAEIPKAAQPAVLRALQLFGPSHATLWLASLAMLLDAPSDLAAGTTVWRARAALQHLQTRSPGAKRGGDTAENVSALQLANSSSLPPQRVPASPSVQPPSVAAIPATPRSLPQTEPASASTTADPATYSSPTSPASPNLNPASPAAPGISFPGQSTAQASPPELSEPTPAPVPHPWQYIGMPTTAGGLFFLLNALERMQISHAIAGGLTLAIPNFVPRVFQHLATRASIAADDPVMLWLNAIAPDAVPEDPVAIEENWWPPNLRHSENPDQPQRLIRAWSLGVRRWCWQWANISVRDIISRPALFTVNRTDLDVSLSIAHADIRVRKAGLDLDPGWVPWFGRVVRFHYAFRGDLHG